MPPWLKNAPSQVFVEWQRSQFVGEPGQRVVGVGRRVVLALVAAGAVARQAGEPGAGVAVAAVGRGVRAGQREGEVVEAGAVPGGRDVTAIAAHGPAVGHVVDGRDRRRELAVTGLAAHVDTAPVADLAARVAAPAGGRGVRADEREAGAVVQRDLLAQRPGVLRVTARALVAERAAVHVLVAALAALLGEQLDRPAVVVAAQALGLVVRALELHAGARLVVELEVRAQLVPAPRDVAQRAVGREAVVRHDDAVPGPPAVTRLVVALGLRDAGEHEQRERGGDAGEARPPSGGSIEVRFHRGPQKRHVRRSIIVVESCSSPKRLSPARLRSTSRARRASSPRLTRCCRSVAWAPLNPC